MEMNWINLIGGYLLIMPLIMGLYRGLPNELELVKYRIRAFLGSIQWIFSYLCAFWLLKSVVLTNPWNLSELDWLADQLNSSLYTWILAVPITALLISWLLGIIFDPLITIFVVIIQRIQGFTRYFPDWINRILSVFLQLPRSVLHTILFALVVHFGVPYLQIPELSKMVSESSFYHFVDNTAISPLMESSLVKQLPVLNKKADNWIKELSKEAANNGPKSIRGYATWQTRFESTPEIDAKAKEIVAGANSDRKKAQKLYQWIGSHIAYDFPKARMIENGEVQTLSFGTVPTYSSRKGVCSDYSSLMVAMGRAVNLKVKQEFGTAYLPDGSTGPHAWNLVYLADENKWIPCDPTWQQAGNFFDNKDFYRTHKADKQEG
ncbi:MAG TPA: transglutaminase domain-containing protein [Bacillota bacterium]|nr:transglutaminase domain-containing protein [Bacillota bacterium]